MKACCDTAENPGNKNPALQQIALLGNPNAGKTTLFNLLTGSRQRTGNWPGVTVEKKEGPFRLGDTDIPVIDLPGTYSLDSGDVSSDERIARDFVQTHPDTLYINVVDASTLERGLYLTLQLQELGVPMLVLLNMMDVAERRGMKIDLPALSARLACPVIPVSLRRDNEIERIRQALLQHDWKPCDAPAIPYHASIENALQQLQAGGNKRAQALIRLQSAPPSTPEYTYRQQIQNETGEALEFLLADARFTAATFTAQAVVRSHGKVSRTLSDRLDHWVLGNFTGVPIFLLMMYLLFMFSINLGGAFIDFFDQAAQVLFVDGLHHLLDPTPVPALLTAFLADGLGGGLQVVATFIPVIGALYLFLTLLEESGYMARAAFVMDQFMRRLGLSGKAFVPLIVGFGCNVPAIMATRTLDSERERILTVLMAPFMSCGARLAVYALFAAAFFKSAGHNIVFLLYLLGIAFAILTAMIMRKTLLAGRADPFMMEMPTYQVPQWRNVLLNTWNKLKGFILGAGKIVVIMVAIINVLNSVGTDGSFGNQNTDRSLLSETAKLVTPVFSPMGISQDNWPATVGIMSGVLAKEVVVGTLDALYSEIDANTAALPTGPEPTTYSLWGGLAAAAATVPEKLAELRQTLLDPLGLNAIGAQQEVSNTTFSAMQHRFDGAIGAFAYLLFILMYFPCVAASGAMVREVGARWASLGILWSTGLGYSAAVVFYQAATWAQHPLSSLGWISAMLALLAAAVFGFRQAGRQRASLKHKGA